MKNTNQQEPGISPIVTGVAGSVIGAGVAVAATVALRDEKTRKKVKKVLMDAKDQIAEHVHSGEQTLHEKGKEVATAATKAVSKK